MGIGVYGTTARMEKGYLLMGAELTSEYSPVEAGLARVGERLQVMYMNECFPVRVAAVGVGLFDPAGGRMRG